MIAVDVWKGLSIATIIFIAGIKSIDAAYYEAAMVDGANFWQKLKSVTIPLSRSLMNSIIILSFIGGLRSFELIWSMTGADPDLRRMLWHLPFTNNMQAVTTGFPQQAM